MQFIIHRLASQAGIALFSAVLAAGSLAAQGQTTPPPSKPMQMEHEHMMDMKEPASGWKELDAFHELMAASWHPASGMNDLAPARAKAADMAKAAKSWAGSKAPKGCDTPAIKDALTGVNAGSQEFVALVSKGTDDATLKAKLGALHQTFEVAESGCKPGK